MPWVQVVPEDGSCRTSTRTSPPSLCSFAARLVEVDGDPPDIDGQLQLGTPRARPGLLTHRRRAGGGLERCGTPVGRVGRVGRVGVGGSAGRSGRSSRSPPSRSPLHPAAQPAAVAVVAPPVVAVLPAAPAPPRVAADSASCTAWATQEFSDTPRAAAACSAWLLICSTSRSVMRLMSPVSAPDGNPGNPRNGGSSSGGCSAAVSPVTATRTSRPSRRTSTSRSSSAAVTSAARSDTRS